MSNPYLEEEAKSNPDLKKVIANNPYMDPRLVAQEYAKYNVSVQTGLQQEPEVQAKANELSRKYNIPAPFIASNLDSFKQKEEKDQFNPEEIKKNNPYLYEWLKKPENVALAKKDLATAKAIDAMARRPVEVEAKKSFIGDLTDTALGRSKDQLKSSALMFRMAHGLGDMNELAQEFSALELASQNQKSPEYVEKFRKEIEPEMEQASKSWKTFTDKYKEESNKDLTSRMAELADLGGDAISEAFDVAIGAVKNPKAIAFQSMESAIQSYTPTVVGLGTGVAGGIGGAKIGGSLGGLPGMALGAGLGSIGGYAGGAYVTGIMMEYMGTLKEVAMEKKLDLTKPENVVKLFTDPKFVEDAKAQALRKGLTVSAIERVTELLGAKIISGAFGKGVSTTAKVAKVVGGATTEAVGEGAGEFFGKAAQKQDIGAANPGDAILEAASAVFMLGGGGALTLAATQTMSIPSKIEVIAKAKQSVESAKLFSDKLQTLGEIALNSEIKNLDSESFKGLIDHTSQSEPVYFQAEDWENHWIKLGENPVAKADELLPGGRQALIQAKENGSAVQVTLGQFVTKFSDEASFKELTQLARQSDTSINGVMASSISANIPAILKEVANQAKKEVETISAEEATLFNFENDVMEQEMAAGASAKDAKAKATLYSRAFKKQAKLSNMSIEEFSKQAGLDIKSFKNMDEANKYIASQKILKSDPTTAKALFQEEAMKTLNKSSLGFYSGIGKAVSEMADLTTSPANNLLNRIKSLPGVKEEELSWTGIQEFLESKGKEKVSKEEVINFLNENNVQVEQVVLGDGVEDASSNSSLAPVFNDANSVFVPMTEFDRYSYNDWVDSESQYEAENIREDEATMAEIRESVMAEENAADLSEKEIESRIDDIVNERAVKYAEEMVDSPDFSYAVYKIVDPNHGIELFYQSEMENYWVETPNSNMERLEGVTSLNEAIIQATQFAIDDGTIVEAGISYTRENVDFSRERYNVPRLKDLTPAKKKKVVEFLKPKKDELEAEAKRVAERYLDDDDTEEKRQAEFKEALENAEEEAYEEAYKAGKFGPVSVNFTVSLAGNEGEITTDKKGNFVLKMDIANVPDTVVKLKSKTVAEVKEEIFKLFEYELMIVPQEAKEEVTKNIDTPTGPVKFASYVLGDGENYREVVLTLPKVPGTFIHTGHYSKIKNAIVHVRLKDRVDSKGRKHLFIEEMQSDWHQQGRQQGYVLSEEERTKLEEERDKLKTEYKEVKQKYNELEDSSELKKLTQAISELESDSRESRRYLEELEEEVEKQEAPLVEIVDGVLAEDEDEVGLDGFLRVVVKGTDTEAKNAPYHLRTAHYGDNYNYKTREEALTAMQRRVDSFNVRKPKEELAKIKSELKDRKEEVELADVSAARAAKELEEYGLSSGLTEAAERTSKLYKEIRELDKKIEADIPVAPFKQTKAWTALALKNVLRIAAVQGYDAVSWTPGYVQAIRWGTFNHIKEFAYKKTEDGKYDFTFVSKKDELGAGVKTLAELEKLGVDKDTIARLEAGEGVENEEGRKVLTETEIKVDDESLSTTYDKILVGAAQDHIKKLDKTAKLELSEIEVPPSNETREQSIIKVATVPMTDKLKEEVLKGQALFQEEEKKKRGFMEPSIPDKLLVGYLSDADNTTGLHEMGHVFLETMKLTYANIKAMASLDKDQEQFAKDFDKTLSEIGAESIEAIATEHHEKFARLFEAFLIEGTAPSPELETVFKRFRTWLVEKYRDIKGIAAAAGFEVNLSKDMKEVFDRLLITEDEINKAEQETGFSEVEIAAFFLALNVKGDEYAKLAEAYEEAHDEAITTLTKEQASQYKKVRTKEYKTRKSELKEQFTAEANANPLYIAVDETKKQNIRMDTAALAAFLSPEQIKIFPQILHKKGGLPIEVVADAVGFNSAKELVEAIAKNPSKPQFIETMTNLALGAEFKDYMSPSQDQALSVAALNAVNNVKKEKVQELELEIMFNNSPEEVKKLIRKAVGRIPTTQESKLQAKKRIKRTAIKDAKAYIYRRLEVKHRKEAGANLTAGKFVEFTKSKLAESFNTQLGLEAALAEERVEAGLSKAAKRFNKSDKDLAKKGNLDMLKVAEAILNNYKMLSDSKADKLEAYLSKLKKYDPAAYAKVEILTEELLNIPAKPFKDLTVQEFDNVMEVVDAIYTLGKEEAKITLDDGTKVAREVVLEKLQEDLSNVDEAAIKRDNTKYERFKGFASSTLANMTRLEHLFKALGKNFTKYFWDIANAADIKYKDDLLIKKQALNKIIETHFKGIFQDKTEINLANYFDDLDPQLTKLTKQELVMALVHSGNDSNKKKLLLGRGWGEQDFEGNLDSSKYDKFIADMIAKGTIDKNLMDGVQAIWDLFEDIKPGVQKTFKKVYGRFFEEIKANPFVTPFGTYRGGYAPAVTDPLVVPKAADNEAVASTELANNTFTFAQTSKGFTKDRVENYAKALLLDFRLIPSHVEQAVRFTHIEPALADLNKLVKDNKLVNTMFSKNQSWMISSIKPWLARLATQQTTPPPKDKAAKYFTKFINTLRGNANMQLMMFNIVNTVENLSDLTTVFLEVDAKHMGQAFKKFRSGPSDLSANIKSLSPFMTQRLDDQIFEINETYNELVRVDDGYTGKLKDIQEFAKRHTYALQKALQNNIEIVVWQAAYDQAISKGASTVQAAKEADSVVRRTLGSGRAIDFSSIETGGALQKLVLTFYGFFNNKANLLYYSKRETKVKAYLLAVAAPAIVGSLLRRATKGNWDEDEDENYLDDVADILFMSQIRFATAFIPGGSNIFRLLEGATNKKPYDDRLSISPLIGMVEGVSGVYRIIESDELKGKDLRDTMNFFGTMTGLPLGPAARPVGFLIDMEQGKQKAENPLDLGRGLLTGKSGKK